MKTRELNRIFKGINFPSQFQSNGNLAYYLLSHETGANVLVGLCLSSSMDPTSFFIQYFVQCLYVPFSTLDFSSGERIGSYWQEDDLTKINKTLASFDAYKRLKTFEDVVPYYVENHYYGNKVGQDMNIGLTLFLQKKYNMSMSYLERIISLKNSENHTWFEQEIANAEIIKSCIQHADYTKGVECMLEWQRMTKECIKLK